MDDDGEQLSDDSKSKVEIELKGDFRFSIAIDVSKEGVGREGIFDHALGGYCTGLIFVQVNHVHPDDLHVGNLTAG